MQSTLNGPADWMQRYIKSHIYRALFRLICDGICCICIIAQFLQVCTVGCCSMNVHNNLYCLSLPCI